MAVTGYAVFQQICFPVFWLISGKSAPDVALSLRALPFKLSQRPKSKGVKQTSDDVRSKREADAMPKPDYALSRRTCCPPAVVMNGQEEEIINLNRIKRIPEWEQDFCWISGALKLSPEIKTAPLQAISPLYDAYFTKDCGLISR